MPSWNNPNRKSIFDLFTSGEAFNRSADTPWVFSLLHSVDDLSGVLPIVPYQSPYSAANGWQALLSHLLPPPSAVSGGAVSESAVSESAVSGSGEPAQSDYLDPQVLVFEDDALTFTQYASATGGGASGASLSGSTGNYTNVSSSNSKLQFNLYWDSSMSAAPAGFKNAVINSAKYYTSLFTTYNGALEVKHAGEPIRLAAGHPA